MSDLTETREIPCQCGTFNLNSYDLPPQNWVYDSSDGFIHTVDVCPEVRLVQLNRTYLASEVLAEAARDATRGIERLDTETYPATSRILRKLAKSLEAYEAAKEGK